MANGEIKSENMLTAFKEMHKVAGMPPEYLYEMLVNGRSAEEVMRQAVAETQYDGGDEEGAGGGPTGGMRLPDFAVTPQDDAFADDLISYGKMMEELTSFSEAYPIKGKEAVDPYIEYLQELMDALPENGDGTEDGDQGDVNNPLQPFGFTPYSDPDIDKPSSFLMKLHADRWEYDKIIARNLSSYRESILPKLKNEDLKTDAVLASLQRLQMLYDLSLPDNRGARMDYQATRKWLRIDDNGRMVAGTPGAVEFNAVMEQLQNANFPSGTESPGHTIMASIFLHLQDRSWEGNKQHHQYNKTTSSLPKLQDEQFRQAYTDTSNRAMFMNELNKIPGSGTYEMEQNKEDMWQQAETVYLLGEDTTKDLRQEGWRIVPDFDKETFIPWAQRWLENPQKLVEQYDADGKDGAQRGDPRGLAKRAHEEALKMVDLENRLKSVMVDGQSYDITEWMNENQDSHIDLWFTQQANTATGRDVNDAAPNEFEDDDAFVKWKKHYDDFEKAYENQMGMGAGLFHPNFSGNKRRWSSLFLVPNTMGMTPAASNAIRRQLSMIADTMRESGWTYAQIAELMTRQTMGTGLEEQAKETGQEWVQGPLPTNMESTDPEFDTPPPEYQKDAPVVAYAGNPFDTDPEFMTPPPNY